MSNTAASTNPFDALSNDIIPNHEALTDPEAQAYTMNPFDDDAAVLGEGLVVMVVFWKIYR